MFSAAPRPTPPVSKPQAAASSAASSSAAGGRGVQGGSEGAGARVKAPIPKPAPKAAPASMIDFGNEAAMLAEHPDLYKGLEEVAGIVTLYNTLNILHNNITHFILLLYNIFINVNIKI